jgi:hypothetical protein
MEAANITVPHGVNSPEHHALIIFMKERLEFGNQGNNY